MVYLPSVELSAEILVEWVVRSRRYSRYGLPSFCRTLSTEILIEWVVYSLITRVGSLLPKLRSLWSIG